MFFLEHLRGASREPVREFLSDLHGLLYGNAIKANQHQQQVPTISAMLSILNKEQV